MRYGRMSFIVMLALAVCGVGFSAAGVSAAATAATNGRPIANAKALDGLGTLAFCWRHDIWTVKDGKAHDLGPGFRPVLSSSGRYVAYIKGFKESSGTLWVARTDGSGQRFAPLGSTPVAATGYAWVSGTDELVAARSKWAAGSRGHTAPSAKTSSSQYGSLWVINASTRNNTTIVSNARIGSVATGAGLVAYSVVHPMPSKYPGNATDVLYVAQLRPHSSPKPLLSTLDSGIQLAGIAGNRILYWVDPQHSGSIAADGMVLYSVRSTGGRPQTLATTLGYPSWLSFSSPDTLYAVTGGLRIVWAKKTLRRYSLTTGKYSLIAGNAANVALDPAANPATGRIAFVAAANLSVKTWGFSSPAPLEQWVASRTLWVTKPGGASPQPVMAAGHGVYHPQWTANPNMILYAKDSGLWLVDLSTGRTVKVVSGILGSSENDLFGFYGHRFMTDEYSWVQ
ncbi:MAG: TolB-like translocation protein [Bacilli bacterium]